MTILIASVITILLLTVMHLARLLFWSEMWTWVRYVIGVLGFALPLTWLLAEWQSWHELVALWALIVSGGGAMLIAFALEEIVDKRRSEQFAKERERRLLENVHD